MTPTEVEPHSCEPDLARVLNALADAVIVADSNYDVVTFNAAAERLFACSGAEVTGRALSEFVPDRVFAARAPRHDPEATRRPDPTGWRDVFSLTRANGGSLQIEVMASHEGAGREAFVTLVLRDITGRRASEAQLQRINGLFAARSHINRAIVASNRRHDLLEMVCRSLVQHAGFRMAWVGWRAPETDALVPVASAGDESGYLANVKIYVDERVEGQGPSGNAFRGGGSPVVVDDIFTDPRCVPWRERATARGFRSCAALPVKLRGEVCGTLNVYASEVEYFKDKEIVLLEETVRDVSFALDNFVREEERAAAEARARRERSLFDAMIESTPGILYLYNEHGRFLRWNRQFELVSGYSADEIADMKPSDFFPIGYRESLNERVAEVFAHGSSALEAPFQPKEGNAIPYYLTGQRITFGGMNCLVGVGIDISDVKQAQTSLEASERRFRTTLDSMLEACQLIGFDWRYLYLNHAAAEQNRRPNAELLGRTMQECWPGIEHTTAFELIHRCMTDRDPLLREVEFTFPDGTVRWFDLRVRPVPEGVFVLSIDITERHEVERALRDMNVNLEQRVAERTDDLRMALIRAEAADRTKSAFLATMSHELRTPLNSIIGFTGILAQGLAGPVNDEQSKQLSMVRASSRHLLELINDVLDISKIEAGELEVEFKPFAIIASVQKIVELLTPAARAKGLALAIQCALPPTQLTSDQRRVEQILLNLVNNAVKFTERGGVTIALVADGDSERAIRIEVKDTGVGIKAEDLDVLFQPFRQIQDGIARPYEGTGLGLAISRRLADLLGAQVEVDSEWGRGSVFTLVLPLAAGDPS